MLNGKQEIARAIHRSADLSSAWSWVSMCLVACACADVALFWCWSKSFPSSQALVRRTSSCLQEVLKYVSWFLNHRAPPFQLCWTLSRQLSPQCVRHALPHGCFSNSRWTNKAWKRTANGNLVGKTNGFGGRKSKTLWNSFFQRRCRASSRV